MGWSKMRLEYRGRLSSEEMDYEAAAKQLIMYSRGVAKGSIEPPTACQWARTLF